MRVFLVSAHAPDLADMLRGLASDIATVASLQALNAARRIGGEPDVVVVDIRRDVGIPGEIAAFRRQHPAVAILVVAARMDPTLMLEAIHAGVNGFVAEPLTLEGLKTAIERAWVPRAAAQRGKLYAFVGGKGGVGTTTLAVNAATALAITSSGPVLFVDLHPAHGDAALYLGAEPRFSILDALENTHKLDEAFFRGLVARTDSGVDLLASPERPMPSMLDPQRVATLLRFVSEHYAHVLVDVPRSDPAVLEALEPASSIVVVANQELPTVRGAARIATALRQRYGGERVQVVVTRYEIEGTIGHEDIERVTGARVRHVFPSDYRLALEALNRGRPLVVQNHNRLAGAFTKFARSLAGLDATPAEPVRPASLFGRLKGKH